VRIGLVSDTHRVNPATRLPAALLRSLVGCDFIFHAGDVNVAWVLETLERVAPVRTVFGNNDSDELRSSLPRVLYFRSGPFSLGLIHGHVDTGRQTAWQHTLATMRGVVDCAIYGHSHRPEITTRDGLLMVNPGSPTQPRYHRIPTYAILEVRDELRPALHDL
jgi:hypothetical protein